MLIGSLGDFHLGHKNCNIQTYITILNELQNKHKVDLIVDGGDLIDKNTINSVQANELYTIFKNLKTEYHLVRGNHDSLSGVSIAQLLAFNKNVTIHNKIEVDKGLLFVPYTDNTKQLYKELKELNLVEPVKYAFSHLNLTSNTYATIPFEKSKNLHLYSENWINSHIHTPEYHNSAYGAIYNIGSVSSLTYGDEHIPSYQIINTETGEIQSIPIDGCIIHKTITTDTDPYDYAHKHHFNKINWRIKIPNNFDINERQKIKEKLKSYSNTLNIQFDYIKTNIDSTKIEKPEKFEKISMLELLIKQYEKDNNIELDKSIKEELF